MNPVVTKQGFKRPHPAKKTKKETIKQVLASPYSPYWPLITNEDCKMLDEALQESIPVKEEKEIITPHWRVLKEMTKEQRKQFKQSNSALKKNYAFGVNEVTRLLEKLKLQAVLIASDVSPRLLVKHVVDLCIIKDVPVLVVPELREKLRQRFGVSAVVFGVKENELLVRTLKNIQSKYPVPEDHIHSLRIVKREGVDIVKNNSLVTVEEVEMEENSDEKLDISSLYLHRTSNSERVFKPEMSQIKSSNVAAPTKRDLEYFALNESVEKPPSLPPQKINYKALVVKRLKGNKNREVRKKEIIN